MRLDVGILALRYGWIPPGQERSITELEYRKARAQPRTRCLMFLLKDDAPWPQKWIDALHDPESGAKIRDLRKELDGIASGMFSSVGDLVQGVMAAIHVEDSKTWKLALQGEFEDSLRRSRVDQVSAPQSLPNTSYKLFLGNSDISQIIDVLQTAIRSAGEARLVRKTLPRLADGGKPDCYFSLACWIVILMSQSWSSQTIIAFSGRAAYRLRVEPSATRFQ